MKFPKSRALVYAVERRDFKSGNSVVTGVFADITEADNFASASFQEWVDKVGNGEGIGFLVTATTFYG